MKIKITVKKNLELMDLSTINIIIYLIFNLILFILSKTVQDSYSFAIFFNSAIFLTNRVSLL